MAGRQLRTALQYMCGNLRPNGEGALSDAHLLERWVMQRDEVAFELLLRRHGPMVFALCRRLLGRKQDAEDAFQATFLVLVRKAASIQKHTALGSWLYKVAYRVALRARHKIALPIAAVDPDRMARESQAEEELVWRDLRPVLDEEVHRLPPRYRDVFVLCYLQGKTNEEAARELGCPLGTVLSRLSRAREHLRGQLTRRGITIGTAALTALLAHEAVSAPLPPLLASVALKHALLTTGTAMAGGQQIPTTISTLTQGVLQAMFLTKIKIALSIVLVVSLTGLTGSYVALQLNASAQESSQGKKAVELNEAKAQPGTVVELHSEIALKGSGESVRALAYSPDGQLFGWGDEKGTIRLWSSTQFQEIIKITDHDRAITKLVFSPDGKYLASAGEDDQIQIRNIPGGKILCKIQHQLPFHSLAFSPDGKRLASSDLNGNMIFYSVPDGKIVKDQMRSPGKGATFIWYALDGKLVASGSDKQAIWFWDVDTGGVTANQNVNGRILTFSPDGKLLAAGDEAGTISLLDVATGKLNRQMKGHTKAILALAFTPDGKILASSAKDQTIRLWDLATGKQVIQGQPKEIILNLAISPSGKQLISGGKEGVIRIWDLNTGIQLGGNKQLSDFWKVKSSDRLSQLVKELIGRKKTNEECVEALCLATLGRFPTQTEVKFAASHLAKSKNRHEALEDILQNLTGTKEFINHLQELQQRGPSAWKVSALEEKFFAARLKDLQKLKSLTVSPKTIDFGTIKLRQTISQKVKIEGEKPFRILTCESKGNNPNLKAEWQENKTAKTHIVTITFDAAQAGNFKGTLLLLQTDHGNKEIVTILVEGKVLSESPSP